MADIVMTKIAGRIAGKIRRENKRGNISKGDQRGTTKENNESKCQ
jgi:hypothetical protein